MRVDVSRTASISNSPWLLSKEQTRRPSRRFRTADATFLRRVRRGPPSSDQIDRHGFRLGVVLHHFLAHLAAPAGLLEAAERPSRIAIIVGVDAERAGLDLARERMGDF